MRRWKVSLQGSRVRDGQGLAEPAPTSGEWRDTCDVAIVGGGIAGVATALFLAEDGARVALFEKGVIGGEASGRAVGFVESLLTDPRKQPALAHTRRIWAGLSDRIGEDTSFRPGMVLAFDSVAEAEAARAWRSDPALDHDARLLDADGLRAAVPALSAAWPLRGGILSTVDGHGDPRRATPAIARGAARRGAALHQNCAVRRVLVENGRAIGVETERGTVRAGAVVLAGGIWNQILAAHLGFDLPQLYGFATATEVRAPGLPTDIAGVVNGCCFRPTPWGTHVVGPHLSLAPVTPLHLRNAWRFRNALRALGPALDFAPAAGHYRFVAQALRWGGSGQSPFEQLRILEPEARRYSEWFALDRLLAPFGLDRVDLVQSWAGALATTPDNMPLLGAVPAIGNLHVISGMYYGFTFAPGLADQLAAAITGRQLPFDGAPFDLARFQGNPTPAFAA